ncbi:MAG: glycosyltransferase family A protein [Actinomycetota bacterium]
MPSGRFEQIQKPARRVVDSARTQGVAGMTSTLSNGYRWRVRRAKQSIARAKRGAAARVPRATASEPTSGGVSLRPAAGPAVDSPRVTVVVTTLNRSELIPIALRSIQLQDLQEWECVVVDDGSTDDTVAVVQQFVEVDPRFRLIAHDTTRGLSAARNTGIANAAAEFVCFLDDDDFLFAGSLAARLSVIEAAPADIAASYCDWLGTDPEVGLERFHLDRKPADRLLFSYTSLRSGPPCIATSPMLRRDVLAGVGGFDESMTRGEDADLWQRILRLGFRFAYAKHVGVAYRRSPGSMVLGAPEAQLDTLVAIDDASDAPDPSVVGHGPLPVSTPLRDLSVDSARAPQRYRYLAMIAQHDPDNAIDVGRKTIPEAVRWEIDPLRLSRELTSYVTARGVIRDSRAAFEATSKVQRLVEELMPSPAAEWTPSADPEGWSDQVAPRGAAIVGRPRIIPATTDAVAGRVVLIAEAEYHVAEIGPLADELERRGQPTVFMLSPKTTDMAIRALGRYADTIAEFDVDASRDAAAVVVLNDWGPVRALVQAANDAGVPTYAKVEGVQDFDDVDTNQDRRAYRTARTVLGQGPNDAAALPDCDVRIVGSSRLERMWKAAPSSGGETVLVNLNFTYHVLTEHRDSWLSSVRAAINTAELPGLVSTHPAERSRRLGLPVASKPFRYEVTRAGVLVSRFSTVPFEAMARGVPFVYHNPHNEKVPTFASPDGAFPITRTAEELAVRIREVGENARAREIWAPFFLSQVDVHEDNSSETRTATAILDALT